MSKAKNRELYETPVFENVREVMDNAFINYPNNVAFKIKEKQGTKNEQTKYKEITYKELQAQMNALGTAFIDMGLKDKRIAIISKNRYEWVLTYIATLNGTGISVPLDKSLPENEIESLLQRSYADCVVFSDEYLEIMKKLQEKKSTKVSVFICMDKVEREKNIIFLYDVLEKGKKLLEDGNKEFIDAKIDNEKLASLVFTSGTTSTSKAVMLSHKNIASDITMMRKTEKMYSTDINMAFLPFHHTFGSTGILMFLNHGATNVFCDGIRYIQNNLKEYGVSVFVCVPLLIEAMYKKIEKEIEKQGKRKLVKIAVPISNFLLKFGIDIRRKVFKDVIDNLGGKIRFIISGASALDKKVAKGFNDFGILTVQGYGLTEAAPVLAAENAANIRYGSIGYPLCGIDMKIDNPDEEGIGEIIAKGPNVMLGYYENEEATKQALKDGWFHTGDLGKVDKDGFFFVTGRKKNVIVLKNGKNIYPEELETLVGKLPYVDECMVFGYPKDDDLVVSVKIVYNKEFIDENYKGISKEELQKKIWEDIKQINSGLVNYMHIKKLIITDEPMIKTSTAKVKRYEELKKILAEEK
ncbi:MAG: AMP-dependent synthetase/ligase [Clostridia bacterium]